jgi:hypothetical protein
VPDLDLAVNCFMIWYCVGLKPPTQALDKKCLKLRQIYYISYHEIFTSKVFWEKQLRNFDFLISVGIFIFDRVPCECCVDNLATNPQNGNVLIQSGVIVPKDELAHVVVDVSNIASRIWHIRLPISYSFVATNIKYNASNTRQM